MCAWLLGRRGGVPTAETESGGRVGTHLRLLLVQSWDGTGPREISGWDTGDAFSHLVHIIRPGGQCVLTPNACFVPFPCARLLLSRGVTPGSGHSREGGPRFPAPSARTVRSHQKWAPHPFSLSLYGSLLRTCTHLSGPSGRASGGCLCASAMPRTPKEEPGRPEAGGVGRAGRAPCASTAGQQPPTDSWRQTAGEERALSGPDDEARTLAGVHGGGHGAGPTQARAGHLQSSHITHTMKKLMIFQ